MKLNELISKYESYINDIENSAEELLYKTDLMDALNESVWDLGDITEDQAGKFIYTLLFDVGAIKHIKFLTGGVGSWFRGQAFDNKEIRLDKYKNLEGYNLSFSQIYAVTIGKNMSPVYDRYMSRDAFDDANIEYLVFEDGSDCYLEGDQLSDAYIGCIELSGDDFLDFASSPDISRFVNRIGEVKVTSPPTDVLDGVDLKETEEYYYVSNYLNVTIAY